MSDEYEAHSASLNRDAMIDEHGIKIAFVMVQPNTGQIGMHWLPDIFLKPMPDGLRRSIAERLRFYADKLESGELEQRMKEFASINTKIGADIDAHAAEAARAVEAAGPDAYETLCAWYACFRTIMGQDVTPNMRIEMLTDLNRELGRKVGPTRRERARGKHQRA
jgi:hypothetical protein